MSYCNSHYEAELWDFGNKSINDICVTWRKGLSRVWGIPMDIPMLYPYRFLMNYVDIIYELCWHNCNFINRCLISDSFLVRYIAVHGIYLGNMSSPLGRNAQFCCDRFNFSICNFSLLSSKFIISKVMASLPDDRKSIAGLVCELCFLRDGSFWLPTPFFTTDEVNSLITYAGRM